MDPPGWAQSWPASGLVANLRRTYRGRELMPRHYPQLDVLRAIAVLLVMLIHNNGNVPSLHLGRFFHYGNSGVDLFFVLSGFLITSILLRTKNENRYFVNFYARRILRIWPLYLCLLVFGLVIVPLVQPQLRPSVAEQCHPWQSYLFFVQNLLVPKSGTFGPLEITWSLCVEEQFYLVWPFIVFLFQPKTVAKIAVAAILLSTGLRFLAEHRWLVIDTYHITLCRLDGLAIGSLGSILLQFHDRKAMQRISAGLLLIGIFGFWATGPLYLAHWMFFTFVSLLFGGLMGLSICTSWFPKPRFLVFTGRISYGLYLLHAPAFDVVRDRHVRSWIAVTHHALLDDLIVFICSMVLAFVLATVSWKVLESPMLSLKRYFEFPEGEIQRDRLPALASTAA